MKLDKYKNHFSLRELETHFYIEIKLVDLA